MVTAFNSIPDWDDRRLLPPYIGNPRAPEGRSPYRISLADMVSRFGDTDSRRELLSGFLDFRAALHQAGLVQGFQWVNGSFVEDIMRIDAREPRDIDVVTFYRLPAEYTQPDFVRDFPLVINSTANKRQYNIDAHFVWLDVDDKYYLARQLTYFNSLWSHNYGWHWKGYLQVELSDPGDHVARNILGRADNKEATK